MCSCCGKCGARCAFHYKNGDRQSCPSSCISSPAVPVTAPDMVSVIAAALVAHKGDFHQDDWWTICKCGVNWPVGGDCKSSEVAAEFAAHQARAVLAAISEAGQVEWAIFRKTADENALPFDWSAGKTYGQSMSRIERMYPRDRDQLQPRSRITGPWTAVE